MVTLRLSIVVVVSILALTLLAWLAPARAPDLSAPHDALARHQVVGAAAAAARRQSCPTRL